MKKQIVVIGGGFAGLEFINHLANNDTYNITLVDINNYNFFPPLIYQVASGFMEPSAISYPFRKILRGKHNVRFRLGSLQKVDTDNNQVILNNGKLSYDILVMCTGTESNFFGNKNIEKHSLPMKTISDALSLRNTLLERLDKATMEKDHLKRQKLLSFVIAGAGPTGVEISGILAEMRHSVMKKDYPELSDEDLGNLYLVDGNKATLAVMSEKAQKYSYDKLIDLGVKIKLGAFVKDFIDGRVVFSDGEEIIAGNLIWAAGVKAKQFEGFKTESIGHAGRLNTNEFNLVNGYENIYALGDCAIMETDKNYPKGHPQLAQPAIQQAKNLAENLKKGTSNWKAFSYHDKGSMAIIGRNKAVLDFPNQKRFMSGFIAWLAWIFVHIMGLVNFKNRIRTFFNWIAYYIYKDQYFRMIIKPNSREKED